MPRPHAFILVLAVTGLAAGEVEVEFRFVPHDAPDQTVDAREHQREVTAPVPGAKGVTMERVGLDAACWSRNVMLDGKPLFEIYVDKKYVDRVPRAKRKLAPGKHVVWPGDHAFTVAEDGSITADSPDLLVDPRLVRIKAYPVTLSAFRADPLSSELPLALRTAPLPSAAVRVASEVEAAAEAEAVKAKGGKAAAVEVRELLPLFDAFAPLTVWLPGNRIGKGYALHPMGFTFKLGGEGVQVEAAPAGVLVDKVSIAIPMLALPVQGPPGTALAVDGAGTAKLRDSETSLWWYPRPAPWNLLVETGRPPLEVSGDLLASPIKVIALDRTPAGQRAVLVEMDRRHFTPGMQAAVRWRLAAPADGPALQPVASLQPVDGGAATALAITAGADGSGTIAIPELPDGIYRLSVGVAAGTAPGLAASLPVTVAKARPFSVGAFTPRRRTAFLRGESFWLAASALPAQGAIPAGIELALDLVDAAGTRIRLAAEQTAGDGRLPRTLIARLDGVATRRLAAGAYRLETSAGAERGRPLAIEIIEPEPATHFTNMFTGKYTSFGARYGKLLASGAGADELAAAMARSGANAFQGFTYSYDRVGFPGAAIERLARERPEIGPWESWAQPSGRDRFLDACVRHGLRFWETLFTYPDCSLPRGERFRSTAARFSALEAHALRHSPAYQGACLYDEIYLNSLNDGVEVCAAFNQAGESEYREAHPGQTSAKALKALDRWMARPAGARDARDLAQWRTWSTWEDELWRRWGATTSGAVREAAPGSRNMVLNRYWGGNGGNIAVNGYDPIVYSNVDAAAACVMYKDGGWGDRPLFAAMQADVMRVRDDLPVWTQLHTFHAPGISTRHLIRNAFLAISQRIEGFTWFTVDFDHDEPGDDQRWALEAVARDLTTPYGDFLLSLDKGYRKVAIHFSRAALDLAPRKSSGQRYQIEGLWIACLRAGFPADILYDEQILAGKGRDYDVVITPGFAIEDECPPELLAALRGISEAGKVLAVERGSRLPIDTAVRIQHDLDEYNDGLGGSFPRYIDFPDKVTADRTVEMTAVMREFLGKRIKPAAKHDLLFGPDWLRRGAGEYLVVAASGDAGFTGIRTTVHQPPQVARLSVPRRDGVCYDLMAMRQVPTTSDGEWTAVDADMRRLPGTILAFLPEAIGGVALQASPEVEAGQTLAWSIAVAGASGKAIDAAFPIEIRLSDPAGAERLHVWRAAAPRNQDGWQVPANVPAGTWKLSVRELASGRTAEVAFTVKAAAAGVAATGETRRTLITDAPRIRATLLATDAPLLIPLEPAQAWAKPAAERIVAALAKAGGQARIVDAAEVALPGESLWRGDRVHPAFRVDGRVLLIGRRHENRLIETLVQRQALDEAPGAGWPGGGRAALAWTRRGFSPQHNTISLIAADAAGLDAGVEALLGLLAAEPPTEAPLRTLAAAPAPQAAASAAGTAGKPAPAVLADAIAGEDRVRSVAVADDGRVLVGTWGYGDNLFCLAADGKLLWKTYLPEHDVYRAMWIDGGKRIVAATGKVGDLFLLDPADGRVLRRVRVDEWPQMHYQEGIVGAWPGITDNRQRRQLLVRGGSGVLALSYELERQWFYDRSPVITTYPPDRINPGDAPAFPNYATVGSVVLSPDGAHLAVADLDMVGSTPGLQQGTIDNLWACRPKVLDAATGMVVQSGEGEARKAWAWTGDAGSTREPSGWTIAWPTGSEFPLLTRDDAKGWTKPLRQDGTLGDEVRRFGWDLPGGHFLAVDFSSVERRDGEGRQLWRRQLDAPCLTSADHLDAAGTRLYRVQRDALAGRSALLAIDLASGALAWSRPLPGDATLGLAGAGVIAGNDNGEVVAFAADGAESWRIDLRRLHEPPAGDYAAFVAAARERLAAVTTQVLPASVDRPGDLDGVLRFGSEQLADGACEGGEAWQGATFAEAGESGKGLRLAPGALVTQTLPRRVIPQATYLLEFRYRCAAGARIIAGARLADAAGNATFAVSRRERTGDGWTFARVAIKTLATTTALSVGFEAEGGEVLVDTASLRPVRFPSANLLANQRLHAIEPTFVRDQRIRYQKVPDDIKMSGNRVTAFRVGGTNSAVMPMEEEAFLNNGRIDDTGRSFFWQPDGVGYGVAFRKPAWVSHVVLYLSSAVADADLPGCIAIQVGDAKTRAPRTVALARGDRRRFMVIRLPEPVQADSMSIIPAFAALAKNEAITEIEIYGPPGGPEAVSERAFPEGDGAWPMFMGHPSHVHPAPPADLLGDLVQASAGGGPSPAFGAAPVLADGRLAVPDVGGSWQARPWESTAKRARGAETGGWNVGLAPTGTPAWYAGRLLGAAADERLHCVSDLGMALWEFAAGGRILASPCPVGDDVYIGSDDGRVYRLDLDSGILLWEYDAGGTVRGAPACADGRIYAPSGDGFLHAIDAESGRAVWKAPIAAETRAAAAVAGGRVWLGDEGGAMRCFDAASGRELWSVALDDRISACPVVTATGAIFAGDRGAIACVGADGAVRWRRQLGAEMPGQPLPTASQIVVPLVGAVAILRQADGEPDPRVRPPAEKPGRVQAALPYRGKLVLWEATARVTSMGRSFDSQLRLWAPPAPATPAEQAKP